MGREIDNRQIDTQADRHTDRQGSVKDENRLTSCRSMRDLVWGRARQRPLKPHREWIHRTAKLVGDNGAYEKDWQ